MSSGNAAAQAGTKRRASLISTESDTCLMIALDMDGCILSVFDILEFIDCTATLSNHFDLLFTLLFKKDDDDSDHQTNFPGLTGSVTLSDEAIKELAKEFRENQEKALEDFINKHYAEDPYRKEILTRLLSKNASEIAKLISAEGGVNELLDLIIACNKKLFDDIFTKAKINNYIVKFILGTARQHAKLDYINISRTPGWEVSNDKVVSVKSGPFRSGRDAKRVFSVSAFLVLDAIKKYFNEKCRLSGIDNDSSQQFTVSYQTLSDLGGGAPNCKLHGEGWCEFLLKNMSDGKTTNGALFNAYESRVNLTLHNPKEAIKLRTACEDNNKKELMALHLKLIKREVEGSQRVHYCLYDDREDILEGVKEVLQKNDFGVDSVGKVGIAIALYGLFCWEPRYTCVYGGPLILGASGLPATFFEHAIADAVISAGAAAAVSL